MQKTSRSTAALLAIAALTGIGVTASNEGPIQDQRLVVDQGQATQSTRGTEQNSPSRLGERNGITKTIFGGYGSWRPKRRKQGPGWTHAHVQRMARKARNQRRNKAAHRG